MNTNAQLRLLLLAIFLALPALARAQNKNIGIGTSNPNPAAILDISSTDKGVLIPRLTSAQLAAISTPPEGLMVYNLDSACYFYYNNFQWVSLCHPGTASNGAHIAIVNGRTDVQLGGALLQNTDIPLAGYKLTFSSTASGGNVGIGNTSPDASAILDLSNTNNAGILIPKVSLTDTNQAAPVTSPATGLMVFNTNTVANVTPGYYYWNGSKWERIFSTNLPVVSTVSVTAPIVNTGTARDPNIGITTSDLKSGGVISITNGTNVLTGNTGADLDVVGTAGGVLYGSGTSSAFTSAGIVGQYLRSQGTGSPAWTTGNDINGSTVVTVTNGTAQGVGSGTIGIDVTGTSGGVLYGTGASSQFTPQGTTGYLLQSNGSAAPSWVNPNAALVTSDIVGSSVVNVINGTNKAINGGNVNLDVVGTNGGVMYGTGTSSAFTPAGTAGQVLRSTGAGAPVWASPNATLATNNVTGGSVVNITNGANQVVGGVNMNIDVAGTNGGVMYGTGSSSGFSAAGASGQVLKSNGAAAPSWVNANSTLTTTNITGSGPVVVTNGTAQTIGTGNPTISVAGTSGAVLYGTGASSTFTAAGTTGQILQSNGASTPTWVNANSALTTKNLTNAGNGVITVTNGVGQLVGATNAGVDVAGTSGGVLYGTGASSAFTSASTAANQVLYTPTAGGTPQWGSLGGTTMVIYAPFYNGNGGALAYAGGSNLIYGPLTGALNNIPANELFFQIAMPKCVITRIRVLAYPGANTCAGTTFIVRKNAVATALTVTLPTATYTPVIGTGSVAFADGDLLSINGVLGAGGLLALAGIQITYYPLP
ncbi:MAG: hypothetical protein JSS82_16150 [Bacteroidetes bacterium]|nr:hypothetical protein [Bacteroidota bacterium]